MSGEIFFPNNSSYVFTSDCVYSGEDFELISGDSYLTRDAVIREQLIIPQGCTNLLSQLTIRNNEGSTINFGRSRFYMSLLDVTNYVDENEESAPIAYSEITFVNGLSLAPGAILRHGFLCGAVADNQLVSLFDGPSQTNTSTGNFAEMTDMDPYKIYFSKNVGLMLRFAQNVTARDFTVTFRNNAINLT